MSLTNITDPRIVIVWSMMIFCIVVVVISLMVLTMTYNERAKTANFKLPDLYTTEKSYRSSKIPKKIPEVSDKEVEELIKNTKPNPSSIDLAEMERDLKRPRRRRIYLPNLNTEKTSKTSTFTYKPIEVKTEFDNLMDELDEGEDFDE